MRAYYFGNMYLSSIQQGIQALHATTQIMVKYLRTESPQSDQFNMYFEWAKNHSTVVLCNAGFGSEIRSLVDFFSAQENPYPFAPFYEDYNALDGALTSVGIILPEHIYERKNMVIVKREIVYPLEETTLDWALDPVNDTIVRYQKPFTTPGTLPYINLTEYEAKLVKRIGSYPLAR